MQAESSNLDLTIIVNSTNNLARIYEQTFEVNLELTGPNGVNPFQAVATLVLIDQCFNNTVFGLATQSFDLQ